MVDLIQGVANVGFTFLIIVIGLIFMMDTIKDKGDSND